MKITAKPYPKANPQTVLKGGQQIPTSKVDSIKAANPAVARVIGNPFRTGGDGSMMGYGADASDAIKKSMGMP